jgi:CheY-like chemotaxis protein
MSPKNSILIVEDEPINSELLKIFLESYYSLTFAENVDAAMHAVDTQKFDLIITDIRLGNHLGGIQLLRHTRQAALNQRTPVVAYTASDTSINQRSFADEGFSGFIPKPAFQDEMLKRVREIIQTSK